MCRHLLIPLNPSYGQRWDEADDDGLRSRLTGFKQSNRINETGSNFKLQFFNFNFQLINRSTANFWTGVELVQKIRSSWSSLRVPYKLWRHLWRWPCASMGPLQTTKTWDQSTKNNGSKFSTRGESLQHLIGLLLSSQVARRDRERIPASVQCPWHFTGKFTSAKGRGFRTKNPLES